jgi:hypothetical protein
MSHRSPGFVLVSARTVGLVTEIYRSVDGRYSIERTVDGYWVYDEETGDEVWSCRTLPQLYEWMTERGLRPDDFEEVS